VRFQKTLTAAAALALFNGSSATASDWQKVEDPKELRALYANKTHRQKSYSGEAWVTHYRADGKALFVLGERRIPRTWEVKGDDQVCWKDDIQGQSCVRVERNKQNPNEIITQSAGGNFALTGGMVRIEDGIPQF
jgi:hypothetical protein